jgi:hypothetical protein
MEQIILALLVRGFKPPESMGQGCLEQLLPLTVSSLALNSFE